MLAALSSALLAPLACRVAARLGAIDVPGGRRIHSAPTPRAGGLAIYLGLVLSLVIVGRVDHSILIAWFARPWQWASLALCASGLMLLGLIDDRRSIRPLVKLLFEGIAAITVVHAGYRIDAIGAVAIGWVAAPVTIVWIVSVTNAINLIDGRDGLAPGVGLIASLALFLVSVKVGNADSALVLASLSGALRGYGLGMSGNVQGAGHDYVVPDAAGNPKRHRGRRRDRSARWGYTGQRSRP